jgi:NAD(P)-dependent dehydrogenase (short-subunit alcohol dehydrogenase family)
MDFQLNGKTCLITGGAGSIGVASARLFLELGANVVLVDQDAEAIGRAANTLGAPGETLKTVVADVSSEDDVKRYVSTAVTEFGKIDVLFSNAGTFGTVALITEYPTDTFDSVMAVHVRGAFLAAKHAVPHMPKGGSIVITSSVAGLRGDPGVYGYITAKHALTGLMRVLAKDLAPRGIRVNTINPGPVSNEFQQRVEDDLGQIIGRNGTEFFDEIIPMGRHASPEEVARSVLYLASAQSSFTTGTVLSVDGGMSV